MPVGLAADIEPIGIGEPAGSRLEAPMPSVLTRLPS